MNKYNNIIELIKSNKGCTLNSDLTEFKEKNGFMVSLYGIEKTLNININNITTTDQNKIIDIIKEYQVIINKYTSNNYYIGLWYNDGVLYFDISKKIKNKHDAILTGIKNKQLSIYDIKNNNCIELLKNVYIVYKVDKIKNDIKYITEFYSAKDINKYFNLSNNTNIHKYIINDIDKINNTEFINNNYIIFKDKISVYDI